jgi:hypothetical protein
MCVCVCVLHASERYPYLFYVNLVIKSSVYACVTRNRSTTYATARQMLAITLRDVSVLMCDPSFPKPKEGSAPASLRLGEAANLAPQTTAPPPPCVAPLPE